MLNAIFDKEINPDRNLHNIVRHEYRYFSPHNFDIYKNNLSDCNLMLSILHNNVISLKRNIEAFQNNLLCELNYPFSIIGVSETRIVGNQPLDFNADLPACYIFEHVSTPLSAGGVGIYIADNTNYLIVEKTSNIYFQTLWIELVKEDKQSIICDVLYRQHNDPTKFLDYLSET